MQSGDLVEKFAGYASELLAEPARALGTPLPGAAEALLVLACRRVADRPVLWIADGPHTLEVVHQDMQTLGGIDEGELLYFPPWEAAPGSDVQPDPQVAGMRLDALRRLGGAAPPPVIATCIQALMQQTLPPDVLQARTVSLTVGSETEPDELAQHLVDVGYSFVPRVDAPGEACLRGGLLDCWPLTATAPFRLEFDAATVASIRTFDPATQSSVERCIAADLTPAQERPGSGTGPTLLLDHVPRETLLIWSNWSELESHAHAYVQLVAENGDAAPPPTFEAIVRTAREHGHDQIMLGALSDATHASLPIEPVHGVFDLPRETLEPDLMAQMRQALIGDLVKRARGGHDVLMFFDTDASRKHFRQQIRPGKRRPVTLCTGSLSGGFVAVDTGVTVVAESDLYGRRKLSSRRYDPRPRSSRFAQVSGAPVVDLSSLEPGDLVVHVDHGVGRYEGLHEILFGGRNQEVLTIAYADDGRLHVPVSQAHLLSRYVGVGGRNVRLHRLGGRRWKREKDEAETAIFDLASSLLETQAQRSLLRGHACRADTPWQREFEASFPYRETADQQATISSVKQDMESTRPMDRLVCGDAGYGKTEVAMRAAFKAVMDERQVAVLVPTTVLAQQHYDTFVARMSAYPVRIEMLSRFCTMAQRRAIVAGLADGTIDVVIGTHALVQPSIRFKNLGLVMIDEEQRFGVEDKERLKHMKALVDVLTLTATPIPRTLHMSMTGARDMSLMQTPPRERMAIETVVTRNTDETIRAAIRREITRDGQVFYLHNRVMTIHRVRDRIRRLVPEATAEVAHGQMSSSELAAVMHRFVAREISVLVCTTIIESGVDIPSANTILIDRADRFGIADLYQLRGRVGRSCHKAYAYLLLPRHGSVESEARKRIAALKRHSGLSAGFSLALRDLEIRGAGNLLGRQQSGHIASLGFGLYCQLLQRTVARLQGRDVAPLVAATIKLDFIDLTAHPAHRDTCAAIPYRYIEDEALRIGIYRRIAAAGTEKELEDLHSELEDRFGPVPPATGRLLLVARVRIRAAGAGITEVETRGRKVMLTRDGDYIMAGGRFPRLQAEDATERLDEIVEIVSALGQA